MPHVTCLIPNTTQTPPPHLTADHMHVLPHVTSHNHSMYHKSHPTAQHTAHTPHHMSSIRHVTHKPHTLCTHVSMHHTQITPSVSHRQDTPVTQYAHTSHPMLHTRLSLDAVPPAHTICYARSPPPQFLLTRKGNDRHLSDYPHVTKTQQARGKWWGQGDCMQATACF